MRVLFSGSVVSNGGDRAIVETQIDLLSAVDPAVNVVLGDNRPEVANRLLPSLAAVEPVYRSLHLVRWLRPRRLANTFGRRRVLIAALCRRRGLLGFSRALLTDTESQALDHIDGVDAVAYVGGTSLVESYFLDPKFFELELANAAGKPVVLMTQSLGPFTTRRNVRAIRRLCRFSGAVLLRDRRSLAHLRDVGADVSRATVLPDLVFARVTPAAVDQLRQPHGASSGETRVAVSVRTLANYPQFVDSGRPDAVAKAIAAFVTWLVEDRNTMVVFVSTCQGVPEYWTDDSMVADEIVALLPSDVQARVSVDHSARTTDDLVQVLAGFDVVVATRLHAAILALVAGVPVLPIAYEFKTHEVFGDLGIGDLVLDVSDLDTDQLCVGFDALLGLNGERRNEFADRLDDVRRGAATAGQLAFDAFQEHQAVGQVH